MIDFDEPIELDDGREATFTGKIEDYDEGQKCYQVKIKGPYDRCSEPHPRYDNWWYGQDGVWAGGSADRMFTIVNSHKPEMYIKEDWS